jgi:hypothetical protein
LPLNNKHSLAHSHFHYIFICTYSFEQRYIDFTAFLSKRKVGMKPGFPLNHFTIYMYLVILYIFLLGFWSFHAMNVTGHCRVWSQCHWVWFVHTYYITSCKDKISFSSSWNLTLFQILPCTLPAHHYVLAFIVYDISVILRRQTHLWIAYN